MKLLLVIENNNAVINVYKKDMWYQTITIDKSVFFWVFVEEARLLLACIENDPKKLI